ncbi:MAG: hypothetical protein K6E40_06605 [Desulfovibrio sp.]|nr:hypothetical protein [Desulfovibrio sp.]
MKRGNAYGNALAGSENGDVFWAGAGDDSIAGNGGRDCAVWGAEDWGRDTVAATSGTMCIVFSGLASSDVTTKLSGTTMTFAKKADASQKITVSGWAAETHSVVFASVGAMAAFGAWASAASPTLAQAKAARQDVWRVAGLATV